VAGKARVHELAKELGVESKIVLAKLKEMGEFVKSASSTVEAPVARRLRQVFVAPSGAAPMAATAPAAGPVDTTPRVSAKPAPPKRTAAPAAARPKAPVPAPPAPAPAPVAAPASAHDIEVAAAEARAAALKADQAAAVKAAQQAAQQRETVRRQPPAGGAPAGPKPTPGLVPPRPGSPAATPRPGTPGGGAAQPRPPARPPARSGGNNPFGITPSGQRPTPGSMPRPNPASMPPRPSPSSMPPRP